MAEEKEERKPLTHQEVLKLIEELAPREKLEPILNRNCVLRLIEANGGSENELDLSEMKFERGINLNDINLKNVNLTKARLVEAHLEGAKLREAHLEEANLRYAHIEGAELRGTHLEQADLRGAHLKTAHLEKANLNITHLEGADLSLAYLSGANLSGAHLEGADLFNAHLEKANLNITHLEGADLSLAYLSGANLSGAHLEGAKLWHTHLIGADLAVAHLEGASLWSANLEGVSLWSAKFSSETELQNVKWDNYILLEERDWHKGRENLILGRAEDTYRRLKQWYTEHGLYDVAGKFFYREMEAQRKAQSWKKKLHLKLWSWVLRLLCGYGEKPLRVIVWAASVVFGLALIYFLIGSVWEWWAFWKSLYFSAVSFTALGYGSWLQMTNDWMKGIGAFESFIGVFTMALFLVTFIRKMTR